MKTAKQELHDLIDQLPDDVSLDAALYDLQFKASVLRGLDEAARGEGISHDEAKQRLSQWLDSSGRQKFSAT
jgi:predicted transcriptional regulator